MAKTSLLISLMLVLVVMPGIAMSACEESSDTLDIAPAVDLTPKSIIEEPQSKFGYVIVDTGQAKCFNNSIAIICPEEGEAFYGQDAQYAGAQPNYVDNGDGTVTDLNTGLMWQQDPGAKMSYDEAVTGADTFNLAGYNDWRLPTIKELYSLIDFSGLDPSGLDNADTSSLVPFIDTDYFVFEYGDESAGERIIDSQYVSSTKYVNTTMNGDETVFGVNFADGRIKGYGLEIHGSEKTFLVMYVRGNTDYGINDFVDNGDGTITDSATGLMWAQADSGAGMNWEGALTWVQEKNDENYLGYSDWRLPNAKELQSIVDYSRSPATANSAAIDPVFECTAIIDEGGDIDYPFYWTSTTHASMRGGQSAVYIAFGEALGWMQGRSGEYVLMDVHGAGAQRSDPKVGDPDDYPYGRGPQGDVIRIDNYVRLVRGGDVDFTTDTDEPGEPVSTGASMPHGTGADASRLPMPPQEAIGACTSCINGTRCEFESPHGTITGTCQYIKDHCACVPEGGPPLGAP